MNTFTKDVGRILDEEERFLYLYERVLFRYFLENFAPGSLGSTWEAVNECIVMIRLVCKPINITVVATYAPTNPKTQQQISTTTDPFYADLQATISKVLKSDMLLIIVDFNARVG